MTFKRLGASLRGCLWHELGRQRHDTWRGLHDKLFDLGREVCDTDRISAAVRSGADTTGHVPSDTELGVQTGTGLPLEITEGAGATSGTVTLSYDPNLLAINNTATAVALRRPNTMYAVQPRRAAITWSGGTPE